jgi:hypothetical protein
MVCSAVTTTYSPSSSGHPVALHLEGGARNHAHRGRLHAKDRRALLVALATDLGLPRAVRRAEPARVVVLRERERVAVVLIHLARGSHAGAVRGLPVGEGRGFLGGHQRVRWARPVVVPQRQRGGRERGAQVQRHDDFVAVHHVSDGRRIERPLVQRGHGAVLRRVVDEHERLRVVGLVEEVGDALFLHEPRDEREVRLVVLGFMATAAVGTLACRRRA